MKYTISYKLHLKVFLTSILFCIIFFNFINSIIFNFYINILYLFPIKSSTLIAYIAYFLSIFIILIVALIHELIHGFTYKLFGGKVKYFFKILYVATQEVTKKHFTLNQFIIILLSPIALISLISLLLPIWLGSLIFIENFLGSLGDIFMAFEVTKYPKNSKIVDKSYGYDII